MFKNGGGLQAVTKVLLGILGYDWEGILEILQTAVETDAGGANVRPGRFLLVTSVLQLIVKAVQTIQDGGVGEWIQGLIANVKEKIDSFSIADLPKILWGAVMENWYMFLPSLTAKAITKLSALLPTGTKTRTQLVPHPFLIRAFLIRGTKTRTQLVPHPFLIRSSSPDETAALFFQVS